MDFQSMNDELYEGYGQTRDGEIQALFKALEAQQGETDIANLQSVGALQPQSLEGTLALLTHSEKHLTLWRDIPKSTAFSTLEEYSVQTGYGSEGGWVGQMESPLEGDPSAKRKFSETKFQRDMWKISDVAGIVTTITNAESWAKYAATQRLLRRTNQTLYSGDSALISEQIDGFEKTIRNNGSADHVRDLRGNAPTELDFRDGAQLITDNFGNADGAGLYVSSAGMSTISNILTGNALNANSAQRFLQGSVSGDGALSLGSKITQIHTDFGTIMPKVDLFIAGEYEAKGVPTRQDPSNPEVFIEGKTSTRSPETPTFTLTVNAPVQPNSQWITTGVRKATGAETYSYRVAAGNRFGRSAAAAVKVAGAISASGSITITITPNPNSSFPATYYEIYSEQEAGDGKLLFLGKIAANGAAPVDFVDLNASIPGTTKMFLLDLTSMGDFRTFTLGRLAPVHSKEYARIGEYRWGTVNLYANVKYYAPLRFVMFDNVQVGLPNVSPHLNV